MAIPADRAGSTSPEPSQASSQHPSLHRRSRVVSSAVDSCSATASDTSSKTNSTDSPYESGVGTIYDADILDRVGEVREEEEKKGSSSAMNGGVDHGSGKGKGGGVPAMFLYRASAPAHRRVKESPLSSDAIFQQSHAGLLNLCIVVLIAVNSRLIIENLMKYGLLIRTGFLFSSRPLRDWPLLMCCLSLPAFPLGAFTVEKLAQHKFIPEPLVISLHIMLTTATIMYPVVVILRYDSAVVSGLTLMLFASINWLKLVSYAHTNSDLRTLSKSVDKVKPFFMISCMV